MMSPEERKEHDLRNRIAITWLYMGVNGIRIMCRYRARWCSIWTRKQAYRIDHINTFKRQR